MSAGISSLPEFGDAGLDEALLGRLADSVNARIDTADRRMLLLLRVLYTAELPHSLFEQAQQAVTHFRFSAVEPGDDAMVYWDESNFLCFAVAEYLAGQLFPGQTFLNDGRSGRRHRHNAEERLHAWLADRFRFGFSEWLAPDRLADDVCALALLIDHAEDDQLVTRASIILDLILLDACLHSFDGNLMAVAARSSADTQRNASESTMACVLNSALDRASMHEMSADNLCTIFATRLRYQVPPVIKAIGLDDCHRRIEISQGLDVDEVARELQNHPDYVSQGQQDRARFNWTMRAFTNAETIRLSKSTARSLQLSDHPELAILRPFKNVPDKALPKFVQALRPASAGRALQRANVQTFRTPQYQLSSIQRYHPGEFGDQQHLWHARLHGGVEVYGTHPGTGALHNIGGGSTPSYWVGNGVNPDIAQDGNLLLAINNLHVRRGFNEAARQDFMHFYFPFVKFMQTKIGANWVAGRSADGYIGIIGTSQLEQVSETEILQRGKLTGYCVLLGDDEEFGSLGAFIQQLRSFELKLQSQTLVCNTTFAHYSLTFGGDFLVDGKKRSSQYGRYATPVVTAGRNPRKISVRKFDHKLVLDWANCERVIS